MKGQSLVIQFIIFFLLGFSLFLSIGSFFRYQSDLFRDDIISSSLGLANSYMSSLMITAVDSCKQCDYISLSAPISNLTAGYVIRMDLANSGLNISIPYKFFNSTVHNLNADPSLSLSGSSSSAQPITLTFNKNQNKLKVS